MPSPVEHSNASGCINRLGGLPAAAIATATTSPYIRLAQDMDGWIPILEQPMDQPASLKQNRAKLNLCATYATELPHCCDPYKTAPPSSKESHHPRLAG